MDLVKILAEPKLEEPVAIVGFAGWANAGEVSTSALAFLHKGLGAFPLAEINPDPFYDFTAHRPTGRIRDGRVAQVSLPRNSFAYVAPGKGPGVILFQGDEPHLNWRRYVRLVVDTLLKFGARLVICLGGTYDERLHTDPPLVSVITEEMVLGEAARQLGCVPGQYDGPISIHTPLYVALRERGLPVVALWGHAPVYVQSGNFRLILRLIEIIAGLGGPALSLAPLEEACPEMDQQIEALIQRSPKLASYIQRLKEAPASAETAATSPPQEGAKVIPLSKARRDEEPPS